MAKISELPEESVLSVDDLFFITSEGGISKSLAGQKLWDNFLAEAPLDSTKYVRENGAWVANTTVDEYLDFTPLTESPTHTEGRVYYDDNEKALSVQSDVEGTTLNIGQEQYLKVINNSGSTIYNGDCVRADDVDPVAKLPQIVLALADTILNARIFGLVTNDIDDGEEGYVTTYGQLHDLDTSLLITGLPLWLSETVPGAYSTVAPTNGILTQVGGCLVASATVGVVQVIVQNTVALPTILGIMQTTSFNPTLSASHQEIKPYATGTTFAMEQDLTLGTLTVPNAGWYRMSLNMTVTVLAASPNGDLIEFELWNVTQGNQAVSTTITVTSSNLVASRSIAAPFEAEQGDTFVLRIWAPVSVTSLVFDEMSFDMESITVEINV